MRVRMKIPLFHDDQHGTAIVTAAAVRNVLKNAVNMTALAAVDVVAKRTKLWPIG